MLGRWFVGVTLALVLAASPALAIEDEAHTLFNPVPDDELRPLCSDNPGFGVPPCIVDAGHFTVELTAVTATFDSSGGVDTSNYEVADALARVGLTEKLEAFVSWTPFNIHTEKRGGISTTSHQTGGVTLGLKQSLKNPDGAGFSVAVEPSIAIPTDGGRLSGTLALASSLQLAGGWSLGFTPELFVLPNATASGTHIGGSAAVSLSVAVAAFDLGGELYLAEDRDPSGSIQYATANFSLSWQPPKNENLSLDVGFDFGLNAASPDFEVYIGFNRRF